MPAHPPRRLRESYVESSAYLRVHHTVGTVDTSFAHRTAVVVFFVFPFFYVLFRILYHTIPYRLERLGFAPHVC